jgi:hypothetical protein
VKLPNGSRSLIVAREGKDREVAAGDIKWARAKGATIFGQRSAFTYADGYTSISGFFALDTNTWAVREGMSEVELKALVGDY